MKSLTLQQDQHETYHNMGIALERLGRPREAFESYHRALKLAPQPVQPIILYNLGNIHFSQGQYEEALAHYEQAVRLKEDFGEALLNSGNVLVKLHRLEEALQWFHASLRAQLTPAVVNNLGRCLAIMDRIEQAQRLYLQGIKDFPEESSIYGNLLTLSKMLADWDTIEMIEPILEQLTDQDLAQGKKPGETPFMALSWSADAARNLQLAKAYSRHYFPNSKPWTASEPDNAERPLRIGYLSYDYRDHVMAYHSLPLFTEANHDLFVAYAYSCSPRGNDVYRSKIEEAADVYRDMDSMTDLEAANTIVNDEIDILVDLSGYTENHRMGITALRPAPLTVSYMGFPASTGANFIDYILADEVLIPISDQQHYSEQVVSLPHGYLLTGHETLNIPNVDHQTADRKTEGLPEHAFVLAALNRVYKLERPMWQAWMRILLELPNSVLWMSGMFKPAYDRLVNEAVHMGVDPGRFYMARKLAYEAHVARLSVADLALDTAPYNGGSTTANALYAGVPVITLEGTHYASRMSTSMLTKVGLNTLVCRDIEQYVQTAVSLGRDHTKLTSLKRRLNKGVRQSKIFDARAKVAAIEAAYRIMWRRHIAGKQPVAFRVEGA